MAGCYLRKLVAELAGVELPVPVTRFLQGQPVPFALNTRETLAAWCSSHGYDDGQQKALARLIGVITRRDRYLEALAAGEHRIDLDGLDTGPPSEDDRAGVVLGLTALKARRQAGASKPAQPAPVEAHAPPVVPEPVSSSEATVETLSPARPPLLSMPRSARPAPMPGRDQAVKKDVPARPPRPSAVRPIGSPLTLLPVFAVREAVERINNRRHALKLIVAHNRAGNHAAAQAERASWVADAAGVLAGDGHARDVATVQVAGLVDDMLTGVVSRVRL